MNTSLSQVAAFRSTIKTLPCPSDGNNCGYYCFLSQALSITCESKDQEAANTVLLYRQLVASYLEHCAGLERDRGVTVGHISVRETILARSGKELTDEEVSRKGRRQN